MWRFCSAHQLLLLQREWAGQHFPVSQRSTGSKTEREVTQPTENSTCVFAHSQRPPALTDLDQPLCTEQAEEREVCRIHGTGCRVHLVCGRFTLDSAWYN